MFIIVSFIAGFLVGLFYPDVRRATLKTEIGQKVTTFFAKQPK